MSLPRFFLERQALGNELSDAFVLGLSEEDLKHFKVLRLKPGEHIAVIDGSSDYFECEIVDISGSRPLVRIASHKEFARPDFSVTLFQGLPKGDKMDEIVRHATEVGVDHFVPVCFARSIVKLDRKKAAKKQERWQAIARSAAMQSGRFNVPEVEMPCTVEDMCHSLNEFDQVVLYWEEFTQTSKLDKCKKTAVIVGPEGGIEGEEINVILSLCPNAKLASLGSTILRTETAAVVGSSLVIYQLGGLQGAGL